MTEAPRILYCHCAYARVVPAQVKQEVLDGLVASGLPFEAVPDLCEMSASRDPKLKNLAEGGPLRIAACYPRAVKGLFVAAGSPLPESGIEILNMREQAAQDVLYSIAGAGAGAAS